MGFDREDISAKAMNISKVDRKGGRSMMGSYSCYSECPLLQNL